MAFLSESPAKARFFKVMMPGFHKKLRLPPAFCKKLKEEIPEQAFLTSCKGTWRVEIGQCNRGRICFEKGWNDFVEKHDLKIGEFVLFEQIVHMHFKACVFDSTTCEKEFLLEVHEKEESSGRNVDDHAPKAKRGRGRPRKRVGSLHHKEFPVEIHEEEANIGPKVDEHAKEVKRGRGRPRKRDASLQQKEFPVEIHEEEAPSGRNHYDHAIQKREILSNGAASPCLKQSHFVQRIMAYNIIHHSPGVYIPRTISEAYHISEKTRISLRGPSGEWHEVKLTHHRKDRLCMKTGWLEFCTSNKVEQGDVCIFQITCKDTPPSLETVMMDVKVFKTCS